MVRPRAYLHNVLIALDQLLNTLLGGDPDEVLSSRIAKRQDVRLWRWIGAVLEWIDPGHLEEAVEEDEGGDASWGGEDG